MFIFSVQSSETSNSKTVCFSSWIIWNFTKRPCCESSYAPSLSDQNYNCCVTRQRSLFGKLRYRIWHLLVAKGFTSLKARQEWINGISQNVCQISGKIMSLVTFGFSVNLLREYYLKIKNCVSLKSACFTFLWRKMVLGQLRERESLSLCSQFPPLPSHPFPSPFESYHAR